MAESTLPILLSIRRKLPELSGNFRNIAEQILKSPESVLNERVSDLAKRSRCDSAQVIRLCQKFGFDGFSSLKNRIMEDFLKQRRTLESQIPAKGNSFDQLKRKFADEFIRTVNDTLNEVDEAQVGAAAGYVRRSRLILISGFGSSGLVARDLQIKLLRLGFTALFLDDAEILRSMCATLTAEDLFIAISFSGTTKYLLDDVALARKNGTAVIGLTNYPDSPLAAASTLTLLTTADEQQLRLGAMVSVVAQYLVVDVLISFLAKQDRERTEERIISIYRKSVSGENA